MRRGMMGHDGMMMSGRMMGGQMTGHMGSGPWAESDEDWHCPMCGGPNLYKGGRKFLSKEERKELLKEYLGELEAETKAVKELVEEK